MGRGILLGKREPETEGAPLRRLFTVESTGLVAEAIDKSCDVPLERRYLSREARGMRRLSPAPSSYRRVE